MRAAATNGTLGQDDGATAGLGRGQARGSRREGRGPLELLLPRRLHRPALPSPPPPPSQAARPSRGLLPGPGRGQEGSGPQSSPHTPTATNQYLVRHGGGGFPGSPRSSGLGAAEPRAFRRLQPCLPAPQHNTAAAATSATLRVTSAARRAGRRVRWAGKGAAAVCACAAEARTKAVLPHCGLFPVGCLASCFARLACLSQPRCFFVSSRLV